MEISKSKFTTIIWIIFILGAITGFMAHENRDTIEINNAAKNLINHPSEFTNTTFFIPEEIYKNWSDINGSE